MTGKEYLQSIKKLVSQIENNSMKARTFREMAGSVPSPSLSGDHVSYTPSGSASFEKYIMSAEEYENAISEGIKKLEDLKSSMFQLIMQVDNYVLCDLLSMRYIDLLPWPEISDRLGYSLSHTYRLHTEALAEFDEIYASHTDDSDS